MNKMTEEDKKETRIHMEHAFDKLISNYITILESKNLTKNKKQSIINIYQILRINI